MISARFKAAYDVLILIIVDEARMAFLVCGIYKGQLLTSYARAQKPRGNAKRL